MDNALDQHPGLTIVLGGDINQLDVNELCQLTGWNSLVDFPTRGVAYLDTTTTIKIYLRYHFLKKALPVNSLHDKIFRETTLMLKYIYILEIRKSQVGLSRLRS